MTSEVAAEVSSCTGIHPRLRGSGSGWVGWGGAGIEPSGMGFKSLGGLQLPACSGSRRTERQTPPTPAPRARGRVPALSFPRVGVRSRLVPGLCGARSPRPNSFSPCPARSHLWRVSCRGSSSSYGVPKRRKAQAYPGCWEAGQRKILCKWTAGSKGVRSWVWKGPLRSSRGAPGRGSTRLGASRMVAC